MHSSYPRGAKLLPSNGRRGATEYHAREVSAQVQYVAKNVPTRCGLPLYCFSDSSMSMSLRHNQLDPNWMGHEGYAVLEYEPLPNTSEIPIVDTSYLTAQLDIQDSQEQSLVSLIKIKRRIAFLKRLAKSMAGHEKRLLYLRTQAVVTPEEEYFRGFQIRKLRQSCEESCEEILKIALPKDLLDRCIFAETAARSWTNVEHPYSWRDPIFPRLHPKHLRIVIKRELFGDTIQRMISQEKLQKTSKVVEVLQSAADRSQLWFERFLKHTQTEDGRKMISMERPANILAKWRAACDSLGVPTSQPARRIPISPRETSEAAWPNHGGAESSWHSWIEEAKHQIWTLRVCATNLAATSIMTDPQATIRPIPEMLATLLDQMYPIVDPFLRKVLARIEDSMEGYVEAMRNFVFKSSDAAVQRSKPANADRNQPPTSPDDDESGIPATHPRSRAFMQTSKVDIELPIVFNWESEVTVRYKDDVVRCRLAHYEKYRLLWNFNRLDIAENNQQRPHDNHFDEGTDTAEFHAALYVMLKRYDNVIYVPEPFKTGGNMHAAAPETVFHLLKDKFNVQFECFASPSNCFFPRYCSAFPDVDAPFGSLGSFVDFDVLPPGAHEVGPPYTEEVLLWTLIRLERLLEFSEGAAPLTLFFFVPDWSDCAALDRSKGSQWCVANIEGPGNQHVYVGGLQHLVEFKNRYYVPPHTTRCFVFQNDVAQRVAPITEEDKRAIRESMQAGAGRPRNSPCIGGQRHPYRRPHTYDRCSDFNPHPHRVAANRGTVVGPHGMRPVLSSDRTNPSSVAEPVASWRQSATEKPSLRLAPRITRDGTVRSARPQQLCDLDMNWRRPLPAPLSRCCRDPGQRAAAAGHQRPSQSVNDTGIGGQTSAPLDPVGSSDSKQIVELLPCVQLCTTGAIADRDLQPPEVATSAATTPRRAEAGPSLPIFVAAAAPQPIQYLLDATLQEKNGYQS